MSSGQKIAIQVFRVVQNKNDAIEKSELNKMIAAFKDNDLEEIAEWERLSDFFSKEKIEMLKLHPALSNKTISWLLRH